MVSCVLYVYGYVCLIRNDSICFSISVQGFLDVLTAHRTKLYLWKAVCLIPVVWRELRDKIRRVCKCCVPDEPEPIINQNFENEIDTNPNHEVQQ